jgi:uncharacterized protein YutE (UPF0331/DUF86 family)
MRVNFKDYLLNSAKIANEEREILDYLSQKEFLSPIELRASKNSLQVLIENMIEKSKRILKHYDCPIIPQRSKDALFILHEVGAISDREFCSLNGAIGFRNSMIHDYMQFINEILFNILKEKKYMDIYNFLVDEVEYRSVIINRIENYIF